VLVLDVWWSNILKNKKIKEENNNKRIFPSEYLSFYLWLRTRPLNTFASATTTVVR